MAVGRTAFFLCVALHGNGASAAGLGGVASAASGAIEHCVTSRVGFTCVSSGGRAAFLRAGGRAIMLSRMCAQTMLITASALITREIFIDMRDTTKLALAGGDVAAVPKKPPRPIVRPPADMAPAGAQSEAQALLLPERFFRRWPLREKAAAAPAEEAPAYVLETPW